MDEFDEIVREFLVESYENLDQLDRDLVALEQEPDAHPLLQSIFRTIHTIKGTSGFLAFGKLEALTHAGEGLLARLRDGGLRLTQARTTALLELMDAVRGILSSIEHTGAENDRDYSELVALLKGLQEPTSELEDSVVRPADGYRRGESSRRRHARSSPGTDYVRGVRRTSVAVTCREAEVIRPDRPTLSIDRLRRQARPHRSLCTDRGLPPFPCRPREAHGPRRATGEARDERQPVGVRP